MRLLHRVNFEIRVSWSVYGSMEARLARLVKRCKHLLLSPRSHPEAIVAVFGYDWTSTPFSTDPKTNTFVKTSNPKAVCVGANGAATPLKQHPGRLNTYARPFERTCAKTGRETTLWQFYTYLGLAFLSPRLSVRPRVF